MKNFFKDFKAFIAKGNILDMAVGVIIGGAFGKIVTSLVNDIIMPLISCIIGVSFADWKWVVHPAVMDGDVIVKAETAVMYGNFIQATVDFLIIALCIFAALRIMMNLHNARKKTEVLTKEEVKALKKEGKSKEQIAEIDAQKKAEMEAAKAAEPAPETVESLLKDIKVLLEDKKKDNK